MNAGHSIVLIDDNATNLEATARILKNQGYELYQAETGLAGVNLARAHKPDLVLSDVDLPDIDGIEVCRRLKADPDMAGTWVVLVSHSSIDSDSQARGMEEGADGYIARPIPNRELLARVKAMLRLQAAESAVRQKARQQSIIANLGQLGLAGTGIEELVEAAVAQTATGLGLAPSRVIFSPGGEDARAGGSCMEVAIRGQNGPFGVLEAMSCPSGDYSEDDAGFLKSVGNILSLSIMRKQAEEDIRFLARHDSLTGLYNRAHFEAVIRSPAAGLEFPVWAIMVDVDGLKRVNDLFGHEAGDRLLKAAGLVLSMTFRSGDIVARIGGDEFVIMIPAADPAEVERLMVSVRDRLASGHHDLPEGLSLRFSMGLACAGSPEELDAALRRADERMYAEKEEHHRVAASSPEAPPGGRR